MPGTSTAMRFVRAKSLHANKVKWLCPICIIIGTYRQEPGGNPMLFTKKMEPSCSYCQRGKAVTPETVLCKKKGVVSMDGACSGFRYDPLKRVPPRPITPDFSKLSEEDFSL